MSAKCASKVTTDRRRRKARRLPNAELTRKCGDLYVLIAQRHPKDCSITASANGLVSQFFCLDRFVLAKGQEVWV